MDREGKEGGRGGKSSSRAVTLNSVSSWQHENDNLEMEVL